MSPSSDAIRPPRSRDHLDIAPVDEELLQMQMADTDPAIHTGVSARAALVTFVASEIIMFTTALALGRSQWFRGDEWDFLAARTAGDPEDLLRPHNEHWTTLPILAFRALWWAFGARTYVPYLAVLLVLHLSAAALLRVVMRRAGVRPWTSTFAAAAFVLFGGGGFNITFAFQITLVGSLTFGLTHLLLADHDGPIGRRDVVGLAAGIASLLCSGLGITTSVVVTIAVLLRRGWRAALFHCMPLATIYLAWFLTFGRNSVDGVGSASGTAQFVGNNLWGTLRDLGHQQGVGIAIAAVVVAGLSLRWMAVSDAATRRTLAATIALLAGVLAFLTVTGLARSEAQGVFTGIEQPDYQSRYAYVVAAMLLPAVAVAADELGRRWRFGALGTALLLIGIPGNARILADELRTTDPFIAAEQQDLLAIPRLDVARDVSPALEVPLPFTAFVTVGWLLESDESGRLPAPTHLTAADATRLTLALALRQTTADATLRCLDVNAQTRYSLDKGSVVVVDRGRVALTQVVKETVQSPEVVYRSPRALEVIVPAITLLIEPSGPQSRVRLCDR